MCVKAIYNTWPDFSFINTQSCFSMFFGEIFPFKVEGGGLGGWGTVGQEAVELICQNARKMRQNEAMSLWPLLTTKMKLIWMKVLKKWLSVKKHFWPCQWWLWPIGAIKRPAEPSPFFGVRRTWLSGVISPPYPEVTLDTSTLMQNITNVDVELIRQPKGPNWPTVPPPYPE